MLNTKTQEHEIVSACGLISTKFYLEKATMPTTLKSQTPTPALYESYFCALTKPSNGVFPYDLKNMIKSMQQKFKIELCESERALLAYLLCKVQALDVDIIVGHDLFGFNLDILLNRCAVKKAPHWSRLGRLKRSEMPSANHKKTTNSTTANLITQQRIQTVFAGRLLCDIMISAKELLTKCKGYDLNDLVSHVLFKKENNSLTRDFEEEKNVANYYNSSQSLLKFLQLAMMDATYIMRICNDIQCLQLAYQITCIAGNVLSRTLTGGRSERNEFLLLHAFNDKEFILPEKQTGFRARAAKQQQQQQQASAKAKAKVKAEATISTQNQTQMEEDGVDEDDRMLSRMVLNENGGGDEDEEGKKRAGDEKSAPSHVAHNGYTGGLVLEPRVGFYDRFILLLDFNSLYPSIIQEYNICFTTIARPSNELAERDIDEVRNKCY
jgi:DNA polymerase alpha subunit A